LQLAVITLVHLFHVFHPVALIAPFRTVCKTSFHVSSADPLEGMWCKFHGTASALERCFIKSFGKPFIKFNYCFYSNARWGFFF